MDFRKNDFNLYYSILTWNRKGKLIGCQGLNLRLKRFKRWKNALHSRDFFLTGIYTNVVNHVDTKGDSVSNVK